MRKLGRALGVEAMSLYRYVDGKEALLDAVVELLTEEIEVPPPGATPWVESARAVVRSYRQLAYTHPHAFPLIALRPLNTPAAIRRAEAFLAVLTHAGLDRDAAVLVFRTLHSYAAGYLLEELAGGAPRVTTGDRDAEFEFGLDAVLAGLAAKLGTREA